MTLRKGGAPRAMIVSLVLLPPHTTPPPCSQINVCRNGRFLSGSGSEGGLSSILEDGEEAEGEGAWTEIATPVLLPLPQLEHGYRSHRSQVRVLLTLPPPLLLLLLPLRMKLLPLLRLNA